MNHPRSAPLLFAPLLLIVACGTHSPAPDTADPLIDASTPIDAAPLPPHDAGASPSDSGSAPKDAATVDAADATPDTTSLFPDAGRDAGIDAPPFVDAAPAMDASDDTSGDSGPAIICPGGPMVFTMTAVGIGGPIAGGTTVTLTRLTADWNTGESPFMVEANGASPDLTLQFMSNPPVIPSPGTYPVNGSAFGDAAITVSLGGCQSAGGSVTLITDDADDAGVHALLATYDVTCSSIGYPNSEISGCVRYQEDLGPFDASVVPAEPGYDAGPVVSLDGGPDATEYLSPCLGHPYALYVEGEPLTSSPIMVTEAQGTWLSSEYNADNTVNVQTDTTWRVELSPPPTDLLVVGETYDDAGILPSAGPHFFLMANGVNCESPSATFTIYDYVYEAGDNEMPVPRITASFETTCANGPGVVRGCVRIAE